MPTPTKKAPNPKPTKPATRYSAVVHAEIVGYVRAGYSLDDAAKLSYVDGRTVRRWISEDKDGTVRYPELAQDVERARLQVKGDALRDLIEASRPRFIKPSASELRSFGLDPDSKDPDVLQAIAKIRPVFVKPNIKAATFLLQTRYPEEFALPTTRVELSGAQGGPVVVELPDLAAMDPDTVLALAYGPDAARAARAGRATSDRVDEAPEPKPRRKRAAS